MKVIGILSAIVVVAVTTLASAKQPYLESVPISIGRQLEAPPSRNDVRFVEL